MRSTYETLVACPQCLGAVNASLEVERAILDVLTRIALSPAWDDANAPRLERIVTRLVQEYDERVQLRVTREPLLEQPLGESGARQSRARKRGIDDD